MSQFHPVNDLIETIAEASGACVHEDRVRAISAAYVAIAEDTRPVRQTDVSGFAPASIFRAE